MWAQMLYTLSMVWAVISNVQKSTVSRNPCNSVVKLPLRVRELQRVKKNWKKRTKSKKMPRRFSTRLSLYTWKND